MKNLSLTLAIVTLFISACKKELVNKYEETQNATAAASVSVEKMNEIKVPAGFKWELSRDVKVVVNTGDNRFGQAIHKVIVYTSNPATGGVKLAEGPVKLNQPFEAKVHLANTIKDVYVVKVAPDQSKLMERVAISGNSASANITPGASVKLGKTSSGPDCSTGCTNTVYNASGNLTYTSGTYCLTGSSIAIDKLTIGGTAIVRVCGSGTINDVLFNTSASQFIITSSGNVTFTKTIPIDEGYFKNYGTMSVVTGENFNVNATATFENYGTCNFGKHFNPNGSSIVTNNGFIEVAEKLINSANNIFTNNCKLIVHDDFQNNGTFHNYGYIKCDKESSILGGSNMVFKQYNGALLHTYDIQVNGTITGIGTTSMIKVIHDSKGNTSGLVDGTQAYCDLNGIEALFNASISGGAIQSCSTNIPATACNPGNVTVCTADADMDGISDCLDCYPLDATKAFCNPIPASTVAFEDLWPSKGDYDMNDVVVSYTYNVITNAAGNVARVEATYTLHATGGSFNNGFAVQFPVNRSQVSGVTGATLEAGQSKAVLVMFTDMRAEMNMWNTVPSQGSSPVKTYTVAFNITGGPSLATFGLNGYNPFIWNNTSGFGRGYEIHLPGFMPTDLASSSIFGTYNDATNISTSNTYISNDGGYPWAIRIPGVFNYPVEKADINTAYTKFATWVSSGGAQFNDWYTSGTGYRNMSNIY